MYPVAPGGGLLLPGFGPIPNSNYAPPGFQPPPHGQGPPPSSLAVHQREQEDAKREDEEEQEERQREDYGFPDLVFTLACEEHRANNKLKATFCCLSKGCDKPVPVPKPSPNQGISISLSQHSKRLCDDHKPGSASANFLVENVLDSEEFLAKKCIARGCFCKVGSNHSKHLNFNMMSPNSNLCGGDRCTCTENREQYEMQKPTIPKNAPISAMYPQFAPRCRSLKGLLGSRDDVWKACRPLLRVAAFGNSRMSHLLRSTWSVLVTTQKQLCLLAFPLRRAKKRYLAYLIERRLKEQIIDSTSEVRTPHRTVTDLLARLGKSTTLCFTYNNDSKTCQYQNNTCHYAHIKVAEILQAVQEHSSEKIREILESQKKESFCTRFIINASSCKYGNNCKYAHLDAVSIIQALQDRPLLHRKKFAEKNNNNKEKEQEEEAKEEEKKEIKKKKVKDPRKVCVWWKAGKCAYSAQQCSFRHALSDDDDDDDDEDETHEEEKEPEKGQDDQQQQQQFGGDDDKELTVEELEERSLFFELLVGEKGGVTKVIGGRTAEGIGAVTLVSLRTGVPTGNQAQFVRRKMQQEINDLRECVKKQEEKAQSQEKQIQKLTEMVEKLCAKM